MKELEKANTKMSLSGLEKIGVAYMKQKKAGVPMAKITVAWKCKQKCGSGSKLTPEIARGMMAIQAGNSGKLSYHRLRGKLELEGIEFSSCTVYRWTIALGIKKYRRYS